MIPELIGCCIGMLGGIYILYKWRISQPFLSKEQELYVDMELDRFDTILERTSPNWRDWRPKK